jgi:hypothetical protein
VFPFLRKNGKRKEGAPRILRKTAGFNEEEGTEPSLARLKLVITPMSSPARRTRTRAGNIILASSANHVRPAKIA